MDQRFVNEKSYECSENFTIKMSVNHLLLLHLHTKNIEYTRILTNKSYLSTLGNWINRCDTEGIRECSCSLSHYRYDSNDNVCDSHDGSLLTKRTWSISAELIRSLYLYKLSKQNKNCIICHALSTLDVADSVCLYAWTVGIISHPAVWQAEQCLELSWLVEKCLPCVVSHRDTHSQKHTHTHLPLW